MTRQETAHASWDALDEPWRAAIEVAWQAYRYGGIAVGAVLTDLIDRFLGGRFASAAPSPASTARLQAGWKG
jgi:hypothetical protein